VQRPVTPGGDGDREDRGRRQGAGIGEVRGEVGAVVEAGIADEPRIARFLAEVVAEDLLRLDGDAVEIGMRAGQDPTRGQIGNEVGVSQA